MLSSKYHVARDCNTRKQEKNYERDTAARGTVPSKKELKGKVVSHMRKLHKLPRRVKKYFKPPLEVVVI
tara:strand:+ start:221 stop:427 length:207 start_codon:yes stop_codon:yes gene_type:complete